jgi:hypothetical protein
MEVWNNTCSVVIQRRANWRLQMDQLHDLALGVAQRILAAGTEAERYELGVEEEDCSSGEDLVELAIQVLLEEQSRIGCKPERGKDYPAR